MNTVRRIVPLALCFLAVDGVVPVPAVADVTASAIDASFPSLTKVQSEAIRLIREDAEKNLAVEKVIPEVTFQETPEGVLVLDRMTIRSDKKIPDFTPPRETSLEKFFRTGTIARHVGRKTTTRLWSSGNAGIVLSFTR